MLPEIVSLEGLSREGNEVTVSYSGSLPRSHMRWIRVAVGRKYGGTVRFERDDATVPEEKDGNCQEKDEHEA